MQWCLPREGTDLRRDSRRLWLSCFTARIDPEWPIKWWRRLRIISGKWRWIKWDGMKINYLFVNCWKFRIYSSLNVFYHFLFVTMNQERNFVPSWVDLPINYSRTLPNKQLHLLFRKLSSNSALDSCSIVFIIQPTLQGTSLARTKPPPAVSFLTIP